MRKYFNDWDGVTIENEVAPVFTYADDVIVFTESEKQLQRTVLDINVVESIDEWLYIKDLWYLCSVSQLL